MSEHISQILNKLKSEMNSNMLRQSYSDRLGKSESRKNYFSYFCS